LLSSSHVSILAVYAQTLSTDAATDCRPSRSEEHFCHFFLRPPRAIIPQLCAPPHRAMECMLDLLNLLQLQTDGAAVELSRHTTMRASVRRLPLRTEGTSMRWAGALHLHQYLTQSAGRQIAVRRRLSTPRQTQCSPSRPVKRRRPNSSLGRQEG
jgi:hypothetical protein